MKVVLSRKGMDSRAGGIPSPILPDGTLLSLPIPNEKSGVPYGDLVYKGRTFSKLSSRFTRLLIFRSIRSVTLTRIFTVY